MAGDRERVTFTRGAADRIANAVRKVEIGDRDGGALKFERQDAPLPRAFRVCTYTGSWSIGSSQAVTFRNVTSTPNTISVMNLTMHLPLVGTATTFDCAVAKDGTAWYLVSAEEHNVKRGTFTAPWSKGQTAIVYLASGGTVVPLNRHVSIPGTGAKNCSVARDGMSWELIAAEC